MRKRIAAVGIAVLLAFAGVFSGTAMADGGSYGSGHTFYQCHYSLSMGDRLLRESSFKSIVDLDGTFNIGRYTISINCEEI
ncbi:MAG: hypothetical protein L0177_01210 [Chloroflexi bacterium]|nr:hypothetical protein [Chloroflexota bacterium]